MSGWGIMWSAPRVVHFGSDEGYPEKDAEERKQYEELKEKFEGKDD